jgi:mRNA interferase MazF
MNVRRGDVVVVNFTPIQPAAGTRPALVVQNDRDNGRMQNTIIAQVTSNISRAHEDTQLLVDPSHRAWSLTGLRFPSVVNCSNLATVRQQHVIRVIGSLPADLMKQVDGCLNAALGLP